MKIRGTEVPIALTMVGGYPRPHWLQGRVFGSKETPLYTRMAQRVSYEDAVRLCCQDQERAGLDLFADGMQYEDYEAHGFQQDVIYHYIAEFLGGFTSWGAPHPFPQWSAYYVPEIVGDISWERSMFQGVVDAAKRATDRPFKIGFLGPTQLSIVAKDNHYNDQGAVALAIADALNQELHYLHDTFGLEAAQMIDVSPHYLSEPWQVEAINRTFAGLDDMLKLWHVCYGRTEGQVVIWDNKVPEVLALLADTNVDVLLHEMAGRDHSEVASFKKFPQDKVLCAGVINDHEMQIERPEDVADAIRRVADVVPPERLMVAPDCGLRWLPRHVAAQKLAVMGEAARTVRAEL